MDTPIDLLKANQYKSWNAQPNEIKESESNYKLFNGQQLNWLATIYYDWHPRVGKVSVIELLGEIPKIRKLEIVNLAFDFTKGYVREELAESLYSKVEGAQNMEFYELNYLWLSVEKDESVKRNLIHSILHFAETHPPAVENVLVQTKADKDTAAIIANRIKSYYERDERHHPLATRLWSEIEKLHGDPWQFFESSTGLDDFDNTFYFPL